jgi:hypothetical protein
METTATATTTTPTSSNQSLKIEAACNEACRDVSLLARSRKESGRPLPTSEVLAVALQRLLSHGVRGGDWHDCVDYLVGEAADLRWRELVTAGGVEPRVEPRG